MLTKVGNTSSTVNLARILLNVSSLKLFFFFPPMDEACNGSVFNNL